MKAFFAYYVSTYIVLLTCLRKYVRGAVSLKARKASKLVHTTSFLVSPAIAVCPGGLEEPL